MPSTAPLTDTERISHLIDDLEKVRTHPIRSLRPVANLLSDAQHAIAAGNMDVAAEFVERALGDVLTEIDWLTIKGNELAS